MSLLEHTVRPLSTNKKFTGKLYLHSSVQHYDIHKTNSLLKMVPETFLVYCKMIILVNSNSNRHFFVDIWPQL